MTIQDINLFLSPSNQTENSYTGVSTNESVQMEKLANAIKTKWTAKGGKCTVMDSVLVPSRYDRPSYAKNKGATHYIPIHSNAYQGTTRGCLTIYDSKNPKNKQWAEILRGFTDNVTPWSQTYGIWNNADHPMQELTDTPANIVACYWEVDFHDVSEVATWIVNNIDKLADVFISALLKLEGIADSGPTPTAGTTWDKFSFVGEVSAKYEVGYPKNDGSVIGNTAGDAGGKSYGIFQFPTKWDLANAFADWLYKQAPNSTTLALSNAQNGTTEFDNLWKQTNTILTPAKFIKFQLQYVMPKYYQPAYDKLKADTGIDANTNRGLQEMLWATSVWFGPNTSVFRDAGINSSMTPTQIIEKVQEQKINGMETYKSLSPSLWDSLKKRVRDEKIDFLDYVTKPTLIPGEVAQEEAPEIKSNSKWPSKPSGTLNTLNENSAIVSRMEPWSKIEGLVRQPQFLASVRSEGQNTLSIIYNKYAFAPVMENGKQINYKGYIDFKSILKDYLQDKSYKINHVKLLYSRANDDAPTDIPVPLIIIFNEGLSTQFIKYGTPCVKGQSGEMIFSLEQRDQVLAGDTLMFTYKSSNLNEYAQFENIRLEVNLSLDIDYFD